MFMYRKNAAPCCFFLIMLLSGCNQNLDVSESADTQVINNLLDDFHLAAANGNKAKYLGKFHDTGVFMGTDDWERWTLPKFTEYVDSRFQGGKGWSYKSLERHIGFSETNQTAWFDEIIYSTEWGRFRGTGVVLREGDGWKIAHYSMSILIPNESWDEITKLAKEGYSLRLKNKD